MSEMSEEEPLPPRRGPGRPPANEFAGLTALECCDACYEKKRCVITAAGTGICGKSGLQAADMMNPEVIRTYKRAKRLIAHQSVENRIRE